ncbi:alpha/beta hydrolase [Sporobolomyces koalae]|uniref:alpha/beta hydrolase n=1 Tax=Sporobolomyces koalae TaxID=500713 RepID=UPI00317182CF
MSTDGPQDPARPQPDARIPYKSISDHDIHLEVYLPTSEQVSAAGTGSSSKGLPVFLWLHGGGWFDGAASDWSHPILFSVLARGWAFVAVDYRLVPQVTLQDCVQDVKDACQFVRSGSLNEKLGRAKLDGERLALTGSSAGKSYSRESAASILIAVFGASAGAALAIFASYTMSPPPKVVYSLYGGSDLSFPSFHSTVAFPSGHIPESEVSSHLSPTGPVVSHSPAQVDFSTLVAQGRTRACFWALQEGKAIELSVPGLEKGAEDPLLDPFIASKLVTPTTPPTVLVHGTADLMVPFAISEKLFNTLRANGIDTELLQQDGANHGFDMIPGVWGDKEKMKVFEQANDFVARYI